LCFILETFFVGVVPVYAIIYFAKKKQQVQSYNTIDSTSISSNKLLQFLTQLAGGILFATVFIDLLPQITGDFQTYLNSNQTFISGYEKSSIVYKIPYVELSICIGFFVIYFVGEFMHVILDHYYNNSNDNYQKSVIEQFLRGLVFVAAFSVDAVFDGLAIGLQQTVAQLWAMFFALSTQKLIVTFVMSTQIYDQSKNIAIVAFHIFLYSLMSPIGLLIEILTQQTLESSSKEINPVLVLLKSLSSGIILYIVFYELLDKSKCNHLSGLIRLISIIFGFSIMFIIDILILL